jgi:UDP:flavonoid glycosyltransferase YjiC (YdhE family)
MLSVPVRKQFEQILNARYLEKLGYGAYAEEATEPAARSFLERLPGHERSLAGYRQDGNRDTLAALDRMLERAARGEPGAALDPLA